MKAVLLPGDGTVRVEERDVPKVGPDDVLVQTKASAICRSDMGLYKGADAIVGGDAAGTGLIVPGHEASGVVVDVGPHVDGFSGGERVAAYLALGCGRCQHCRSGYHMLCDDWKCLGFDVDGGDADYFVIPAHNALPLPDCLSYVAGAVLTDMIGSQHHTQRVLNVRGDDTVAVIGLGPMGAAAAMVAAAFGATVIAVDVLPARLDIASALGASATVDARGGNALTEIAELTHGRGVDVAIDCSGSPAGQNLALDAAAKQGRVALVGESRATEIRPSDQIIRKLLTVVGGWYFPIGEWPDIVRLVTDKNLPVENMVTHQFAIDDAPTAFAKFDSRETEKAIFTWSP